MNRSRFRVRVRFWQKLEALHEALAHAFAGNVPSPMPG